MDGDGVRNLEIRLACVVWFVGPIKSARSVIEDGQAWSWGEAYPNKALVPPSINTGTVSFQSLLLRLASTLIVGT